MEDLLFEWFDWRGYIVKRNIKVGRLEHGGWESELDLVAYHPITGELIQVEPSIDSHAWAKREERFAKKFASGREYVHSEVFPWLHRNKRLSQLAVLISRGDRDKLAGAELRTIDEVVAQIREDVERKGKLASGAIAEQYPLLRTVQLCLNGYYRAL